MSVSSKAMDSGSPFPHVRKPPTEQDVRHSRDATADGLANDIPKKHANDFRAVLEAHWYRELFPGTRIGQKDSEIEIELTARGGRLATSVGGTLTGRCGEMIIIDDPLKPDDAYSDAKRNAANEWFKNTLMSYENPQSKRTLV